MNLAFLQQIGHRPYPLPTARWVMQQTWHDLLFAHWPVPVEMMRRAVPRALELDTFEGQAWLAVVPFGMRGVYPRYTFPVPGLSAFLELNVRTYVTMEGRPGVYFFSLDAANPLAVEIARRWYHLPYYIARMRLEADAEGWINYHSTRTHTNAPKAEFKGRYRPTSDVFFSQHGSLEYFLTERYCLYTLVRGSVQRGEIHHAQWPLQRAEAEIDINTMTLPHGVPLPATPPLLHFVRSIDTVEWPIGPLGA
jgi:hypothetical protein